MTRWPARSRPGSRSPERVDTRGDDYTACPPERPIGQSGSSPGRFARRGLDRRCGVRHSDRTYRRSRMSDGQIVVSRLTKQYKKLTRRRRPVVHRRARSGHRLPRPERRRQDHHAAHAAEPGHADRRHAPRSVAAATPTSTDPLRLGRRRARGVQRAQGSHRAQPSPDRSAPPPAFRIRGPTRC